MDESQLPLGRHAKYGTTYDAGVLRAIPRAGPRAELGIAQGDALPFTGVDRWHAHEVSWLQPTGLPRVATLTLDIPCTTANIVESKSLKLYLNTFAMTRFADPGEVVDRVHNDVSAVVGGEIAVAARGIGEERRAGPTGDCLDDLPVEISEYAYAPSLLEFDDEAGTDAVYSHLFRSVCPVTGQPDWGTISVRYEGRTVLRESLLRYLVSFRTMSGFHEDAVERIFVDLLKGMQPNSLRVEGCFLRRGGIDINPVRGAGGDVNGLEWGDPRQ